MVLGVGGSGVMSRLNVLRNDARYVLLRQRREEEASVHVYNAQNPPAGALRSTTLNVSSPPAGPEHDHASGCCH